MMPLKIKTGLVHQNPYILQLVTSTMSLEIDLGLVFLSGGLISWESPDSDIGVVDNLGNQVLDNDSWFDPIFCYNNFHW